MIKFSVPLCIAAVSYWMLSGYTKVVISQQLGNHSNGLYAVASKFTSMITLLITVFQYAWNELAYLMVKEKDRVITYQRSIEYIFRIIMLGSGGFLLFIKTIFPYLVDSTYREALVIVPLSLVGVAANAFANFLGTIFMAEKRTRWIFWTTAISASINIACLWAFVPIWGLQGAVGALCLSFVAIAIFRIYIIKKIFNINFSPLNLVYIPILAIYIYMFFLLDTVFELFIASIILIGIAIYSFRDIFAVLWRNLLKK